MIRTSLEQGNITSLKQVNRTSLKQVIRTSVKQVIRTSLEQVNRTSLEQLIWTSLEQVFRTSVKQVIRTSLEQVNRASLEQLMRAFVDQIRLTWLTLSWLMFLQSSELTSEKPRQPRDLTTYWTGLGFTYQRVCVCVSEFLVNWGWFKMKSISQPHTWTLTNNNLHLLPQTNP